MYFYMFLLQKKLYRMIKVISNLMHQVIIAINTQTWETEIDLLKKNYKYFIL